MVDLARHATKVEQRTDGDLRSARQQEIEIQQNDAFRQATNDLQNLIDENRSADAFPSIAVSRKRAIPLEERLVELEEHFAACKTKVFGDAKLVLGDNFDPAIKSVRDELEASRQSPALSQLGEISKLPSMARLGALSKLTDGEIAVADQALAKTFNEAAILRELATNSDVGRRKQLYARVSAWMSEHGYPLEASCAVCGGDLNSVYDFLKHISRCETNFAKLLREMPNS